MRCLPSTKKNRRKNDKIWPKHTNKPGPICACSHLQPTTQTHPWPKPETHIHYLHACSLKTTHARPTMPHASTPGLQQKPPQLSRLKRLGFAAQNSLLRLDKGKMSKFSPFSPFQSWLWPCFRQKVKIRVNFSLHRLRPTK